VPLVGLAFVCGGDASDVVGGTNGDARYSRRLGQNGFIKVAVHRNQNIKKREVIFVKYLQKSFIF
jgi:hypothetical protein